MPTPTQAALTLQQVHDLIGSTPALSPQRRSTMRSSIKRFCEICGRSMSDVIADPAVFRKLAGEAAWQMSGISKAGWANLRSNTVAAMAQAGVKVHRSRRNFKLSPDWDALLATLDEMGRRDLRRFAGWCATLNIAPAAVTSDVFGRFLSYLETECVQRNPRERWHVARRVWNKIACETSSGYPQIDNVEPEGWRGLAWESFPQSLRDDVKTYSDWAIKAASPGKSTFLETLGQVQQGKTPRAPIRQITLHGYLANIRRYLSRLAEDGVSLAEMVSLAWCVDVHRVEQGLTLHLGDRQLDEKSRPGLHALIIAILSIANFANADATSLNELRKLEKIVRYRPAGMTSRNVRRLAQFRDPKVGRLFYALPFVVANRLSAVTKPTIRQAQEMQLACLLAILSHLPLRIASAASIDLGAHIMRPLGGQTGPWLLELPGRFVKTNKVIKGEFNERVSALLERYCAVFRPVLLKSPSSMLFVSQTGRAKGPKALGKQFSKFIKRELGLTFNPHLIRHYTAFVYLAAHPGDFETVRQLLGHSNVKTTIDFYTEKQTERALEQLGKIINEQITQNPVLPKAIRQWPQDPSQFEDRL